MQIQSRPEGEIAEEVAERGTRPSALREVFSLIDGQADGSVGEEDMKRAFKLLQVDLPSRNLESLFHGTDGELSFESWSKRVTESSDYAVKKLVLQARLYREMFAVFDLDGEGEISAEELGYTISKLFGWRPTRYESQKLLETVDSDGEGTINLLEFVQMMRSTEVLKSEALQGIATCLLRTHEMFEMFDLDSGGEVAPDFVISLDEFSKVLTCTGQRTKPEVLSAYFDQIDNDKSGEMDFVEFADLITGPKCEVKTLILERYEELKKLFSLFDADGGGSLSLEELRDILKRLGRRPCDADFLQVLGRSPDDQSDLSEIEFSFNEFVQFVAGTSSASQRGLRQLLREYRDMFLLFDEGRDGTVSIEEYVDTMKLFGIVNVDVKFVREMLRQYDDSETDIEIDFIEFVAMMAADSDVMQKVIRANLVGFREAFKLFDDDDSGSVTNDEFIAAWRSLGLGFSASDDDVIALLQSQDENGDGEMDFTEFVIMLSQGRASNSYDAEDLDSYQGSTNLGDQIRGTLTEIRDAWTLLDPNGDGSIDVEEIGDAFRKCEIPVSDAEIEGMVEAIDDDGSMCVEFTEFMRLMVAKSNFFSPEKEVAVSISEVIASLKSLLAIDPEDRVSSDCKKIANLLRTGLNISCVKKMTEEVAVAFAGGLKLSHHGPFELVFREGELAQKGFIVLEGTLSFWRSKPCCSVDEVEVVQRRQFEKQRAYGCDPLPVLVVPPDCVLSAWAVVKPEVHSLVKNLKELLVAMPSGLSAMSSATVRMVQVAESTVGELKRWLTSCQTGWVDSDLGDVCANSEALFDIREINHNLTRLLALADDIRCELLMRKFYLQLATCKHEGDPLKMAPPYGYEQESEFLDELRQSGRSFLVCKTDLVILEASKGFEELTGYTAQECVGRTPRILQGAETDKPTLEVLKEHMAQAGSRTGSLTVIFRNYKKGGQSFLNMLQLYPVISNEGVVRRWIGVQNDVTISEEFYNMKPQLQQMIECTKKLIVILSKGQKTFQNLLGMGQEEPEGWKQTEIRNAASNHPAAGHAVEEGGKLKHDDQYLGILTAGHTQGESNVLKEELTLNQGSCLSGSEGVLVIEMTRSSAMQAKALEPIELLQRLPSFAQADHNKLNRVAMVMTQRRIRFMDRVVNQGSLAESIIFVQHGVLRLVQDLKVEDPIPGAAPRPSAMTKRRTIALIGSGDTLDQTIERDGKCIWSCSAVADSDNVVIFEVSRMLVEKNLGSECHPAAMLEQRELHRGRVVQELTSSAETMYAPGGLMYRPPSPDALGHPLGWCGGYRFNGAPVSVSPEPPSSPTHKMPVLAAEKPVQALPKQTDRKFLSPSLELHTTQGRLLCPGRSMSLLKSVSPDCFTLDSFSRSGKGTSMHRHTREAASVEKMRQDQDPDNRMVTLQPEHSAIWSGGRQMSSLEKLIAASPACAKAPGRNTKPSRRHPIIEWPAGADNKKVIIRLDRPPACQREKINLRSTRMLAASRFQSTRNSTSISSARTISKFN